MAVPPPVLADETLDVYFQDAYAAVIDTPEFLTLLEQHDFAAAAQIVANKSLRVLQPHLQRIEAKLQALYSAVAPSVQPSAAAARYARIVMAVHCILYMHFQALLPWHCKCPKLNLCLHLCLHRRSADVEPGTTAAPAAAADAAGPSRYAQHMQRSAMHLYLHLRQFYKTSLIDAYLPSLPSCLQRLCWFWCSAEPSCRTMGAVAQPHARSASFICHQESQSIQ